MIRRILIDVLHIDIVGQVGRGGEQIAVRRSDNERHAGAHNQRAEYHGEIIHRHLEDNVRGCIQRGVQLGSLSCHCNNAGDDHYFTDEHANVGLLSLVAVFGRGKTLQHILVAQHQSQRGQEVAQERPAGHTAGKSSLFGRQNSALSAGRAHQNGDGEEKAANHDQGADGIGIGHGNQTAAYGDDHDNNRADGKCHTMRDLNTAGMAQQHQNVGSRFQLRGQHAHIGQHDAQSGDDAGGRAVAGTHDLRHRYLIGLADFASNEIQQNNTDGRSRKGQHTYPRSAAVHDSGRTGNTAAAAPSGQ